MTTASGQYRSLGFALSLNSSCGGTSIRPSAGLTEDQRGGPGSRSSSEAPAAAAAAGRLGGGVGGAGQWGGGLLLPLPPDSGSFVLGKVDPLQQRRAAAALAEAEAAEPEPASRRSTGVMGRGKIEIKKIENPTSRQVTFSKRRGGLLKKAHELAVLCDAEVALIIFSSTGKLFEFASSGSMRDILERYSKCPDGVQTGGNSDFMGREVVKLRQQLERLQHSQRHMLGEDLQVLTVPDLLQLEQQLDLGSQRVRARKNQLLLEEVEELRRKEQDLQAANDELRQKLADANRMIEAGPRGASSGSPPGGQVPSAPTHEAGGSSQQAVTVYPPHLSLREPPTSQTSLHLGLFPESFMPSTSRRPSQQSPTEPEGESSMRWEHPHYRSQK